MVIRARHRAANLCPPRGGFNLLGEFISYASSDSELRLSQRLIAEEGADMPHLS